jgi:hypothetical protein
MLLLCCNHSVVDYTLSSQKRKAAELGGFRSKTGRENQPLYGDLRGKAFTFQADVWLNLTTLARPVRHECADLPLPVTVL